MHYSARTAAVNVSISACVVDQLVQKRTSRRPSGAVPCGSYRPVSGALADKIYRNRENLSYCAAHGIRLSGPALGRSRKNEVRDKKRDYQDQADRVEVERQFSLAKRKCGLGMIVTRLEETTCHYLAMSVLLLNLRKLQRLLHAFFCWWFGVGKMSFVR